MPREGANWTLQRVDLDSISSYPIQGMQMSGLSNIQHPYYKRKPPPKNEMSAIFNAKI